MFSFCEDRLRSSEVDVGRRKVVYTLMTADVIVVFNDFTRRCLAIVVGRRLNSDDVALLGGLVRHTWTTGVYSFR